MLNKISFVGVDEKTNPDDLAELQRLSATDLEFGVLYSPSRAGKKGHPRYPSRDFAKNFPSDCGYGFISLHLCGDAVGEYFNRDQDMLDLCEKYDRIQLNFAMKAYSIEYIIHALNMHANEYNMGSIGKLIIQDNKSKSELIKAITNSSGLSRNIDLLFDGSGGFGREITDVQPARNNFYCGYAGGINPTNVMDIIKKIEAANFGTNNSYYIDMESGIRTNDIFDINKCRDIILQVNDYIIPYYENIRTRS